MHFFSHCFMNLINGYTDIFQSCLQEMVAMLLDLLMMLQNFGLPLTPSTL